MSRDIAVIAGITALVLGLVFVVGPRLSAPAWSPEHMNGPILAPPQNPPAESPAPLPAPILTVRVVDQHSLARIDGAATVTMVDASGRFIDVQRGHADGADIVFRDGQPKWPVRITVRRPQYRELELGLIAAPATVEAGLERLHGVTLTADGSWRHVHLMRLEDHGREPFAMWTRWLAGSNVYELPQGRYHALFSDESDYFNYSENRWLGATGDEATFEVGDGAASVELTPERPVGTHSIHGSLHTNEGVALTGYPVTAILLGPGPLRRVAATVRVDDAGCFALRGLAPGRYRVQPSALVDPHGRNAFADISVPGDAEATLTLAMTMAQPVPELTRDGSVISGAMPYIGFWKAGAGIAVAWLDQPPHRVWSWGDEGTEVWDDWFGIQLPWPSYATLSATIDNGSRTVAMAELWESKSGIWVPLIATEPEDGASLRVSGLRPGEQAEVYVDCLISTALMAKGEGAKESGVLVVDRIPPREYSFKVTAPGYVSLEVEVELEAGQVFDVTLTRVEPPENEKPSKDKPDSHDRPLGGVKVKLPSPATPKPEEPPPPPPVRETDRPVEARRPQPTPREHPADVEAGEVRDVKLAITGVAFADLQAALVHAQTPRWVMTAAVFEHPRTPQRMVVTVHESDGVAILTVTNLSRAAETLTLQVPGREDIVVALSERQHYDLPVK